MAIASTMSSGGVDGEAMDNHEHDLVMPGFRFHPTEEELIDFYLHRKVEGKHFNVELITFLDLYRYDPWELPALAAIGEKEWFFYVPRDRKYRNGDRPNRVTTSGYWKATGVDRLIRNELLRSIGLKKTMVFYSGKAPKGIRTSWIMNEYRLPQIESERYNKAEITLCRVYKRAGVDDHRSLFRPKTFSSLNSAKNSVHQPSSSSTKLQGGGLSSSNMNKFEHAQVMNCTNIIPHDLYPITNALLVEEHAPLHHLPKANISLVSTGPILSCPLISMVPAAVNELHSLVGYNNQSHMQHTIQSQSLQSTHYRPLGDFKSVPVSLSTISEKLIKWSALPSAARDQHNNFI
ncbi:Protein FEZ [Platanthera guangdongensis]|uniref:Protein FEZ n=1 Tax=Platanthera guangdongensis TaxID=2320717 RepID=A0ABR2MA29_9ASPA